MFKTSLILLIAAMLAAIAAPQAVHAEETVVAEPATAPNKAGHIEVNGVSYYYAIYGSGEPLLLLHGGLGSIDMFAPIIPLLAASHEVIGVDLQGHGRTTLGDREFSLNDMADDIAAIMKELGYEEVDVLGYSMGGGVAFRLAVQHSGLAGRVVLVSTPFARDGFFEEMIPQQEAVGAAMADAMKDTPMYKSYVAVAPHPEDFPKLLDRMGEMMRKPYDWSEDARQIDLPVMLVYGDGDMIRPEHIVEFYHHLGGGLRDAGWQREHMSQNRLAILPNLTHYEIFGAPALARTVLPFLEGPTYAEQVEWK